MKVKKVEEEFTSDYNLDYHYNKHIIKNKEFELTQEEYEKAADTLALTEVDNKNIFGYLAKNLDDKVCYCKWNKNTELFVVYYWFNKKPKIITAHHKDFREFNGDKYINYVSEIPKEEIKNNT